MRKIIIESIMSYVCFLVLDSYNIDFVCFGFDWISIRFPIGGPCSVADLDSRRVN